MLDPSRQPEYRFQFIDVQLIDFKDNLINLLSEPIDARTFDTLRKFGQITSLLVQQQTESRYHLLAGYPYFTALKAMGIEQVACQVLPPTTPPVTLYSLQVLHNLSSSPSSPILQAHLLREARQILAEEELLQLLALMGYKPQHYKLEELTGFLQLESSAILALHRGILSQKSGKQLALLSHEDQQSLVNLITDYRLGGSKQQKLIEMVMELVRRNNSSVAEILNKGLLPIAESAANNIPQQVQNLMQYLYEQCYPGKTAAEKVFRSLVQELQPWEGATLVHSLSFEDEQLEIRLRFADTATLRKNWEKIKTIVQ
jgi:ParB family chromosome partitioning protein